MVLKFSGSHRQCKGGTAGSSSFRSKSFHNQRRIHRSGSYPGTDEDEGAFSDAGGGGGGGGGGGYAYSSSSTPAWDFTNVGGSGGGRWEDSRYRTQWGSAAAAAEVVVMEDDGLPKEWTAQVEPGVQITFVSLPAGAGNDLKRIRFSREMFNKWQAQRWWGENYDRIMELYNVQRFSRQALPTPPRSDDGDRESFYSRVGSTRGSPGMPTPPHPLPSAGKERMVSRSAHRHPQPQPQPQPQPPTAYGKAAYYYPSTVPDPSDHIFPPFLNTLHAGIGIGGGASAAGTSGVKVETSSVDASRTTTSSRDEASISISNASELEATEWVEQDEPGVYITIRELADGTRELRRVRFSRERFGEMHAKVWWEENRERIQAQYL
ncbi:protein Brevis radix-like 1 [Ananas comosus]|uniref:Protein Brevis radix-like 1 n=1 Tax=Ananas comosus TaxID=4615 RepID=A0A6P5EWJ5_ANACO|nr:protein Brevis radix-like 1 [Ananas comosus]